MDAGSGWIKSKGRTPPESEAFPSFSSGSDCVHAWKLRKALRCTVGVPASRRRSDFSLGKETRRRRIPEDEEEELYLSGHHQGKQVTLMVSKIYPYSAK